MSTPESSAVSVLSSNTDLLDDALEELYSLSRNFDISLADRNNYYNFFHEGRLAVEQLASRDCGRSPEEPEEEPGVVYRGGPDIIRHVPEIVIGAGMAFATVKSILTPLLAAIKLGDDTAKGVKSVGGLIKTTGKILHKLMGETPAERRTQELEEREADLKRALAEPDVAERVHQLEARKHDIELAQQRADMGITTVTDPNLDRVPHLAATVLAAGEAYLNTFGGDDAQPGPAAASEGPRWRQEESRYR